MYTLTVRNLPEPIVARLKARARSRGHSMEQEARLLLTEVLEPRAERLARIRARWSGLPPVTAADVDHWIDEGRTT